jgi:putative membrane protein
MLSAGSVWAQRRDNNSPSEIKPAQSDSPGAHPVPRPNDAQPALDRQNNERGRSATETTRSSNVRRNREARSDRQGNLERQLAACLLTKNKGEVELGKYASGRAKDRDVREFAERMAKDHQQVVDKLQQIVGSQEPNDQRSQIAREIDEQCLASLKKELSSKSDHEFDACYIGSQIAGHMQMAATLKVISDHASGKLSEVVNDARPTVDEHLSRAKKLMEQLDKSRDRAQASKERSDRAR